MKNVGSFVAFGPKCSSEYALRSLYTLYLREKLVDYVYGMRIFETGRTIKTKKLWERRKIYRN